MSFIRRNSRGHRSLYIFGLGTVSFRRWAYVILVAFVQVPVVIEDRLGFGRTSSRIASAITYFFLLWLAGHVE